MKFFIDTADISEIREAQSLGTDGVTTNPTLIAKTGRPFKEVIHEICELYPVPCLQRQSLKRLRILGPDLAKIADNVVVKLL